eukprot:TRINITY_DN1085_c0_g2_i14.p1 TRINITY_DN1085_c0_g2~~TRINITY_DN1085_c0_g2_i14.p1  ORF type:complete len:415 (+),score=68.92 TRINITY_DN1085_c0_g2_i14:85-1329(+)
MATGFWSFLFGVGTVLLPVITTGMEVVKSLWYISLLGSSFKNIGVDYASLDIVEGEFSDVVGIFDQAIRKILVWLEVAFEYSDFERWTGSATDWDCKGFLCLAATGCLLFLCMILFFIVEKDSLFYVAIQGKAKAESMEGFKKYLLMGVIQVTMIFGIYVLQIVVLFMYRVMITILGMSTSYTSSSCGEVDNVIMGISKYIVISIIIVMIFWYFMLFSGREIGRDFYKGLGKMILFLTLLPFTLPLYFLKPGFRDWMNDENEQVKSMGPKAMGMMIVHSTQRILGLTLGIWTVDSISDFKVMEKAKDFGDESKKSQDEAVMLLTAKCRGMLWILIPGCVFLTKVSELCNSPPVLVDPRADLTFQIHIAFRVFKWLGNITRLVTTILIVIDPSYILILIFLASFVSDLISNIYLL